MIYGFYDVGNHPDVIEHLKEINCDGKKILILYCHIFILTILAPGIKYADYGRMMNRKGIKDIHR